MSNTSTVTPYAPASETSSGLVGSAGVAVGASAVAAAAALASWLCESTPEERACREQIRQSRRNERLTTQPRKRLSTRIESHAAKLCAFELNVTDRDGFLESARSMGYRIEEPRALADPCNAVRLVGGQPGDRIALSTTENGRVTLFAAAGTQAVQRLVQQHTVHKTLQHLQKLGMTPNSRRLANGEIELCAAERTSSKAGKASVHAKFDLNGVVEVDIDGVRGNRCEQITSGVAKAVGGRVTNMNKKHAYFELPGEPARIEIKG